MNIYIDSSRLLILCLAIVLAVAGWKLDSVITALKKPKKAKKGEVKEVGAEVLTIDDSKEVAQSLDVNMYDDDAHECVIGEVDTMLTNRVANSCQYAIKKKVRLHLIINTYGGNPDAANAIVGILAHFQAQGNELRIIVRGVCQSAGMIILMAAPPEHRHAVRGSQFMLHAATRTADGSRDAYTRKIDADMVNVITAGSRIERSSLEHLYESGKDCHVNVDEAVKMGLISEII